MRIHNIFAAIGVTAVSLTALAKDVIHTDTAPRIDGRMDSALWDKAEWQPLTHVMIGDKPTKEDFSGRFKLLWNNDALYLLADIQDDHLSDTYADPLERYWDDDCLEIFIDADRSGGDHLNTYNAFAYHVALDNQVVDIGPAKGEESKPRLFNDHVKSAWKRSAEKPHHIIWETAIRVFGDDFQYGEVNTPVALKAGMKMGFMLAYCDADGGDREHFVGSQDIVPVNGDKNLGYKDASVFGELTLVGK